MCTHSAQQAYGRPDHLVYNLVIIQWTPLLFVLQRLLCQCDGAEVGRHIDQGLPFTLSYQMLEVFVHEDWSHSIGQHHGLQV